MPTTETALTREAANAIYDVLVAHAGASENPDARADFIHAQSTDHVTEYRFGGLLGFGGKFWRGTAALADGTWGEQWYVTAYREDLTDDRTAALDTTNAALAELRLQHLDGPR